MEGMMLQRRMICYHTFMIKTLGQEAAMPNPALKPFNVLIGTWNTVGTHPMVPGVTLHGRTSFEWIEGGAFLLMHSEIDEPLFPSGVAIIASDDNLNEYFMSYFDERGVSRKYEVSLEGNIWKWWRNMPEFSQRFTGTISTDERTIVGKGEMSKNGAPWEGDLNLTYTRVV
jgi:hypothetical protein